MGAMHRPSASDEPALKPSDRRCEATFPEYVAGHEHADLAACRGAYARRRAWLAWRRRMTPAEVDAWLAPHVADLLREGGLVASKADAWCFASKVAVALLCAVSAKEAA